jgi:light-regulated signal transduction histidine kinase (bacteriophytochrome)
MAQLIDDLLRLSQVGRAELQRERVDMSEIAQAVIQDLQRKEPKRSVEFVVQPGLMVEADGRLLRIALENLIGNAWKFTSKTASARIEVGALERDGAAVLFVRDNGAGFDMAYVGKLFAPFQRLHEAHEFPGTGIGLATVYRIVDRHHGRVWAEGAIGSGATIYFTLP